MRDYTREIVQLAGDSHQRRKRLRQLQRLHGKARVQGITVRGFYSAYLYLGNWPAEELARLNPQPALTVEA